MDGAVPEVGVLMAGNESSCGRVGTTSTMGRMVVAAAAAGPAAAAAAAMASTAAGLMFIIMGLGSAVLPS